MLYMLVIKLLIYDRRKRNTKLVERYHLEFDVGPEIIRRKVEAICPVLIQRNRVYAEVYRGLNDGLYGKIENESYE